MSSDNLPTITGDGRDDRKYYFAYHSFHGKVFGFAWAEEDGLPVGGIPKYIEGTKLEITKEEFANGLTDLMKEHPYKGKEGVVALTLDEDPDRI